MTENKVFSNDVLVLAEVVIEADVENIEYSDYDVEVNIRCRVTSSHPPSQVTVDKAPSVSMELK